VEGKVLSVKVRRATIFVTLTLYYWKALFQESFAALKVCPGPFAYYSEKKIPANSAERENFAARHSHLF
jgi:hypothetical protein